ncbi:MULTISPECIES: hypothetical protein [Metabacillus]|uniref:hypothetical protein n=1 Tax=Metabacillus TaxID=2675233 RepID=UPI000C80790C|nr:MULTISPECIES: hypothetical protein [Metabacillus]MCM3443618.1 hypothetical protein [Metabacillus halosaccharovorans]PMC34224.1 hypothetical protein CJ195_24200 [Bacillus sp. UMB0899]
MKKEEVKSRLLYHKQHLTTVRQWDLYAKDHSLPSSQSLISIYGSWKEVKDELGIKGIDRKEELIEIAKEHIHALTTVENWNKYAKEKKLPNGYTYISHFGSWNAFKEKLNLSPSTPYPSKLEKKKEIISILKEHGAKYEDRTSWDKYANEEDLPTYKTIRNYLTFEEIKEIVPKEIKYNYSKTELIKIAKKHSDYFTSMGKWNEYAKENQLPNSATYHRKFGSWKKAKVEVYNQP